MDSIVTTLITQAIAGAVGGNGIAKAMPEKSLGTVGNSIAGAVGGGLIGQVLPMLIAVPGLEGMVGSLVGGGIGGAIVTALIAYLKGSSKA